MQTLHSWTTSEQNRWQGQWLLCRVFLEMPITKSSMWLIKKKKKTPSDTCEYGNKAIGFSERKDRNSSKRKLVSEVFKRGQMFSCLTRAPDKANSSDCLVWIDQKALHFPLRLLLPCVTFTGLVHHPDTTGTLQIVIVMSLHVKLWSVAFWNRVMSQKKNIQEKVTFYLEKIIQLVTSDHWDSSASSSRE